MKATAQRCRTVKRISAATAALLAALGCAAAPAGAGQRADFKLGLTNPSPASPTGLTLHLFFRAANDPNAKPSPLRSEVLQLPPGFRYDSKTVSECTATDDQMRTLGSDACPADTQLTLGSLTAFTGAGPPFDPIAGDNHVFNGPNQIIEIITFPGAMASPGFDRLTIAGSTVTAHPPMTPGGPPDGQTAIRSIDFQIPVRTAPGRSLMTTPPVCPPGGQWTSSGTFGFADGAKETVVSATPCTQTPTLHITVRPRRVRAGQPVRLRLRARSTASRCTTGASVRLGRHRVRTGPRGRAALSITFRRTGLHRVRVKSPGCRSATALVNVRAASSA